MEKITIEVCIDSIDSALEAKRGGADRIELCSALSEGGLTPTPAFLQQVKKLVDIPIFCMIRPRRGPMIYSNDEKNLMLKEAHDLIGNGADGLVFGALNSQAEVDQQFCEKFLKIAGIIPCTFHRAFDVCSNPLKQLEVIIELGFERLLTSGCKKSAVDGSSFLKTLVAKADGRLKIMAGAGVRSENCVLILKTTGVKELHTSAKTVKKFDIGFSDAKMGASDDDDLIYVASAEEISTIRRCISEI